MNCYLSNSSFAFVFKPPEILQATKIVYSSSVESKPESQQVGQEIREPLDKPQRPYSLQKFRLRYVRTCVFE